LALLLQPKRVTRKGRHYSFAPVEDTGVPTKSLPFSCCARTRKRRSDMLAQKTHENGNDLVALLNVEGKSKSKTLLKKRLNCHLDAGEILF